MLEAYGGIKKKITSGYLVTDEEKPRKKVLDKISRLSNCHNNSFVQKEEKFS